MNLKSGWGGCFVVQLTVLRSSHLGKDTERPRLQIGRTATPVFTFIFRLVLSFKHSLIHGRGTVYVRVFKRQATAIQKVKRCETAHGSFHPSFSSRVITVQNMALKISLLKKNMYLTFMWIKNIMAHSVFETACNHSNLHTQTSMKMFGHVCSWFLSQCSHKLPVVRISDK